MSIDSIKHKDKRAHTPSTEEAGYEESNFRVREKDRAGYPLNPVLHRGQDPELFWMNKYGNDNREELLSVDIRSLYRHEHISPEMLISKLYRLKKQKRSDLQNINELFGNALEMDEIDKVSEYYKHQDGWSNRMIQGDSLLVMTSLLEREGMAGKVQCIYIDPPYGIKYGSNWQIKLNSRNVTDGKDEHLTGEPEQIRAFRDTWELGIHSYLSYLRDRLLVAKELLTESGSCFVQIGEENVHLVRNIMDEVFGSENYVRLISFKTTSGFKTNVLSNTINYLVWYSKSLDNIKFRRLYLEKDISQDNISVYKYVMKKDGTIRKLKKEELNNPNMIPKDCSIFRLDTITSQGMSKFDVEFKGKKYSLKEGLTWKTHKEGMLNLISKNRIGVSGKGLAYIRHLSDFSIKQLTNLWDDTITGSFTESKHFVVQTNQKVIQRCILMTTDPGDLVLDPTCGSGTAAFVAEQWGRRWITIDTSRIALNIAKTRLMTGVFPYYKLYDEESKDIRQGFKYKKVPHITLKSLANDEPPEEETLYDRPYEDKKKLRVAGPFTVETLQNFEPATPEELDRPAEEIENFEQLIFDRLKSSGISNGDKTEHAKFIRIDPLTSSVLHAEGFYMTDKGESKAYIHIGPKYGTVSKKCVNESIMECRNRGDADWLLILGFSFESNIEGSVQSTSIGSFRVDKVRMHDDFLQEGLLKKPSKSSGSFITIGEPDIEIHKTGEEVVVEIKGLDIYDPIKDDVKARNVEDIAYWMVDDDYDGSNFIVRQVFFCGGKKDEFRKWQKGLDNLTKSNRKREAEKTLKIEIDDDAFDRVYGFKSHPIDLDGRRRRIAVRVISQFGEESTKALEVEL